MEYGVVGPTGIEASRLALGTWRFGRTRNGTTEIPPDRAHEILDTARDLGITFIDSANRYGTPPGRSQEIIGDWLADHDREEFVITSKVGVEVGEGPNQAGLSKKHVRRWVDKTLAQLGTDYLDVLYIHRWDDSTEIAQTLSIFDDLVRAGKVLSLGMSTVPAWKLVKALWESERHGYEPITVTQPPLDATYRDEEYPLHIEDYLEVCIDQNLAVCPYSPLAGGVLTGKYSRNGSAPADARRNHEEEFFDKYYLSDRTWDVVEAVQAVAEEVDATPAQVAIRWVLDQEPFTTFPIVGARTPNQLSENVGAIDVSLSNDQFERIDTARQAATE